VVQTNLRGRRRQYECQRLADDLETRVQERTAELGAANQMLLNQVEERERMEATLRQMQRLEAVGQLTSGVAHDFNNLLTVVLGNIAFLEKGLAAAGIDGKLAQRLGYMRTAAERGAKLTDQLLSFSRRQRLEPKPVDLNTSVAGMRDLLQSTMGGSISIETRLLPGVWPAMVDPTQLELAVLNLAINARDAMEIGGTLTVSIRNMTLGAPFYPEEPQAGDYVEVSVGDTGSGMSDDVRAKVFEPFFTTKEIGKGSGLGLSQVLGFAKQSGGGVRIESQVGKGTSVHIYLPRARERPQEATAASARYSEAKVPGANILLVDDDNAVREVTAATLRELGYVVHEAGSGVAALERLANDLAIDLMVIDYAMPGMSGAELARRVHVLRPALPIVFITGFAERDGLAGVGESHIVGKPFVGGELAEKVRSALSGGSRSNVVALWR
jgi:signal transduction histidine kinase